MGEQENDQLILLESLLQERYDDSHRVSSPIFPPTQKFVEDLISIETNDFPILPPPQEFANDSESSELEPESEYSEFCFCCSQIISTPDSSNLEPANKYSEKEKGAEHTTQDSNELKLGNIYEEVPNEVHSNEEQDQSCNEENEESDNRYHNHQIEGRNKRNGKIDTSVRTREEYDEDGNEGHNQTEFAEDEIDDYDLYMKGYLRSQYDPPDLESQYFWLD